MALVGRIADRRALRRAAEQALTVPVMAEPAEGALGQDRFAPAVRRTQSTPLTDGLPDDFTVSPLAASRPRYRSAPVTVVLIAAVAALVVAGVLLAMRTRTDGGEQPTRVAPTGPPSPSPALTTSPPAPHSGQSPASVPPSPPAPPITAATVNPPPVIRPQLPAAVPGPIEEQGNEEEPPPIEEPPEPPSPEVPPPE